MMHISMLAYVMTVYTYTCTRIRTYTYTHTRMDTRWWYLIVAI